MGLLYTIATSPNPNAICALSPSSENCYIAYPLPKPREETADKRPSHAPPLSTYVPPTSGEVLIFDTIALKAVNVVPAHRAPLSRIALNNDGTMLVTASETGTIIRVFSVPRGTKLFQFRRGTYPSTIYSMSFNLSSTLLCVSSTTDTVHIFRLSAQTQGNSIGAHASQGGPRGRARSYDSGNESPAGGVSPGSEVGETPPPRKPNGTFGSMIRRSSQMMGKSVAGVVGGYLPSAVTEMWEPARDFAFIKVPKVSSSSSGGPLRSVVAMSSSSPQVMVVTSDGGFYVFNIDMEHGGEGVLVKQHS